MAETLSTVLTNISSVVTAAIGWVGDFIEPITSNPVLFIFVVAVPLVGLGVGLLNRLIRAN